MAQTSIRIEADTLAWFRARGYSLQRTVNELLAEYIRQVEAEDAAEREQKGGQE